ncbi:Oleate-activated transcription factor 1 [Fusarium oxysporum f. sp. albedinis]|nr:Oleate-activated transcription factor 1 [Fusarium oxysporum f. sp. albedinis]
MTGAPWMRCHETALLALILRRLVLNYLSDSNLYEEFKTLIVEYRTSHAEDKRVLELMVDVMGPDWTTFIASARTLASFSVLSTIECSLNIYYRRLGDVLVAASKEQQADRMEEYHDAEFPLRIVFTAVSFKLIEELSEQILPNGIRPKAFDTKPRVCETLPEHIREVFHLSKAKKINSRHKQHSIVIGSFSASIQIWIRLCWLNNIPATLYMPRLQYHQTSDDSINLVMYKLTSAPVRNHVATEKLGGSFRTINSEHEGIQDEPCWKLGGYSMYHAS